MKTVVVYHSKSGYTEQYAKWMQEALQADLKSLKGTKVKDLQAYDLIIFASGVYAGQIAKLSDYRKMITKLSGKQIILWANGSAPTNQETIDRIKENNLKEEVEERILFYGQSGMDFEKMKPIHRFILNIMANAAEKKDPNELTEDEIGIIEARKNPIDHTDKRYIAPLVDYVRNIAK